METKQALIPGGGLWSEDGDRVWLPLAYAADPLRVKRLAFTGHDLPVSPARELGCEYAGISVRRVHVRPGEQDEYGEFGPGDATWWGCEPAHPRAVEVWEVGFIGGEA